MSRSLLCFWTVFSACLPILSACDNTDTSLLRAHQAANRNELVGGPVAYADTGDFVLENDKIRVAILGVERSWGPGIYGGSLVDADIRRSDSRFPSGQGRDRFAEIFPFANLLVPAPIGTQVTVLSDGSNGKEATVRVEGVGMFLFDGLGILRRDKTALAALYSDPKTAVHFRTDYTVQPGESFVRMKTWVIMDAEAATEHNDVAGRTCKDDSACESPNMKCAPGSDGKSICVCKSFADLGCGAKKCDANGQIAHQFDAYGCETCDCSDSLPMEYSNGSESVFGIILGDSAVGAAPQVKRAGVGAGDFVFFGNQNDIFVPGHGFDEEKPIWDGLFANIDLFAHPLSFDFVSAAGGDVSYAYFSKKIKGTDKDPVVLVPVFTSAATAFVTASLQCDFTRDCTAAGAPADCEALNTAATACQNSRVYEFERYLAVGAGDIGSVSDIVFSGRGTPTGTVKGFVRWREANANATNATVFVLRDPDPKKSWKTADDVITANRLLDGSPGVLNAIDADVGLDPVEDGTFSATLPAGHYVFIAMDEKKVVVGDPVQVEVKVGETNVIAPSLPTPAVVHVAATDGTGAALPAKATVVQLGADGKPLWRDGGRRPYFGQGRLGDGVQFLGFAMDGKFDIPLQAGSYQVVVSHGPEYAILNKTITLAEGDDKPLQATLLREVNTAGWVATDFHLHAEPSFDSGMPLATRVATIAAEGLEYVASTDHDVLSNYQPFIDGFGIQEWLKAVVGSEVSTLEIGHYIGFPLKYDAETVPSHGSVDWYCQQSQGIVNNILAKSGFTSDDKPSTIVAHPRDGFLGWAAQGGVNAYSLQRTLSSLENANPVLRTMGCDFDALELYNGKRFDMIHTPTAAEVMIFERCIYRIDHAHSVKPTDGIRAAADGPDCYLKSAPGPSCHPDPDTKEFPAACEACVTTGLDDACPELTDPKHSDRALTLSPLAKCPGDEATSDWLTCQHRYRIAVAQFVSSEILIRTPAEADAWLAESAKPDGSTTVDTLSKLCTFNDAAKAQIDQDFDTVLKPQDQDRPCARTEGVMEDWANFLEHGLVRSIVGGSDSHGLKGEPGAPRTWIRSTTDSVAQINPKEMAANLRGGQTIASYGPFVEVSVDGGLPGDVVAAKGKTKVSVHVRIQTPSWFAVDRYEVWVNGHVVKEVNLPASATRTALIVDADDTFDVDVPAGRDSWVSVNALGTADWTLMRPVNLDVPFGELQLPRVASMAFANLPVINAIFSTPARIPDFFPIYPMATTGAIFLDADGNGRYDAPLAYPAFCGAPCDSATGKITAGGSKDKDCKSIQIDFVCLTPEGTCGLDVPGVCSIYEAETKSAMHGTFGFHGGK